MPFKSAAHCNAVAYDAFAYVFSFLRFEALGDVARVCRRWRASAADPFWMPDVVVYAWGRRGASGLDIDADRPTLLDFSLANHVRTVCCADEATFAVTLEGHLYHWGRSWHPAINENGAVDAWRADVARPTRVQGVDDVVCVACAPSGYYHGRARAVGYSCAAVAGDGALYTWGNNFYGQLLHPPPRDRGNPLAYLLKRPKRVAFPDGGATVKVAVGLEYLALQRREAGGETRVSCAGRFVDNVDPEPLRPLPELDGVELADLKGGAFHCCALAKTGELWVFGDEYGADEANGNLLGLGEVPRAELGAQGGGGPAPAARGERRVGERSFVSPTVVPGLPSIVSVAASTYATAAVAVDGRCFTWGDADGGALGHAVMPCDRPGWVSALRGATACAAALSYTNGAVATRTGRVYVWGGTAWEGGVAGGRAGGGGAGEVVFGGAPPCYACAELALGHRHGFLVFEKRAGGNGA